MLKRSCVDDATALPELFDLENQLRTLNTTAAATLAARVKPLT